MGRKGDWGRLTLPLMIYVKATLWSYVYILWRNKTTLLDGLFVLRYINYLNSQSLWILAHGGLQPHLTPVVGWLNCELLLYLSPWWTHHRSLICKSAVTLQNTAWPQLPQMSNLCLEISGSIPAVGSIHATSGSTGHHALPEVWFIWQGEQQHEDVLMPAQDALASCQGVQPALDSVSLHLHRPCWPARTRPLC